MYDRDTVSVPAPAVLSPVPMNSIHVPRWRLWRFLGAMLALWLQPVGDARAAGDDPDVEATFERGVAAADAGLWREAARAFSAVCKVAPTSNALLNLATAHYHLEQPLAALAALDQLDALEGVTDVEQRTADKMRQRVGAMVALLAVEVEPLEAQVRVDGRPLPEGERERHLLPGPHHVEARADGYQGASADLDLQNGERRMLRLVLLPEPSNRPDTAAATRAVRDDTTPEEARVQRRRRWLWAVASVVLAGSAAAVVATQVGGGEASCTTGSAGEALGGCAP